ncbi:hypothetical protein [Flammeovirga sp. OC4]|uniref:hypothetical protein n=1 Tax=Flammeovirga sp. OC4 TaxID=1382345 RepID=UPI000A40493B|nr:hypothetical protein [Flammeovirga sp. OC4]
MILRSLLFIFFIATSCSAQITTPERSLVNRNTIFEEKEGIVAVEAEYFYKQEKKNIRKWFKSENLDQSDLVQKGLVEASNNNYIQILPDTRVTHDDMVVRGENFTNTPGQIGVLHYKVMFNEAGRYYVWVRTFSTGSEDNGLHVGLDGEWPESGKKMQWCDGRNEWTWESKQRTKENHCGIPHAIYLDVATPGLHEVQFSMREDGFRFDKFLMTKDSLYVPEGEGIEVAIVKRKSKVTP